MSFTPYVVGNQNDAKFHKIQDAIDAAKVVGGGAVYLQPGIYEENLILQDKVNLCGIGGIADCQSCVIIGLHTPPICGDISIINLCLKSKSSIFLDSRPGTGSIFLNNCFLSAKDGYVFDLENWKSPGKFVCFDLGDTNSTNNGFINNKRGAQVLIIAASIGKGKNKMVLSGEANFFMAQISCPIKLVGSAKVNFCSGCCIDETIHAFDQSEFNVSNSQFNIRNENELLTYDSLEESFISESCINSKSSVKISGSGKGALNLGSITSNAPLSFSKEINLQYGSFITGNIYLLGKKQGIHIAEGENARMGTVKLAEGKAFVSTTSISKKSRIFLTPQSGNENSGFVSVSEQIPKKGFSIISSNNFDEAEVAWFIIDGYY